MNRLILLILLLLMVPIAAYSQLSVSLGAGIGTFRMKQLRKYSDDLKAATPVNTKTFGNYGPYAGYEAGLSYGWNKNHLGVFVGITSTGSITTRTDYSGSVDYKHKLLMKMIAFQYGWDIKSNNEKWNFSPSVRAGVLMTTYDFEYKIQVNDGSAPSKQQLGFKSLSGMISPGLAFRYKLTDDITAVADLRYLLDLKADLRYDKDKNVRLIDKDNETTTADWSGFRGVISLEFRLKERTSK